MRSFSQNPNQNLPRFLPYALIDFQGRNLGNFWMAFWEKRWPHEFILNLSDLNSKYVLGGLTFLNGLSGLWITFNNLAVTSSTKSVVKSPSFVKCSSFSGNNFLIVCNKIMSPSAILEDKIDKLQKSRNSPKKLKEILSFHSFVLKGCVIVIWKCSEMRNWKSTRKQIKIWVYIEIFLKENKFDW